MLQIHWLPGGDSLPEKVLVSEFMEPAPAVDAGLIRGAPLCGLHTATVSAWDAVVAAHSLAFDDHIFLIGEQSIQPHLAPAPWNLEALPNYW